MTRYLPAQTGTNYPKMPWKKTASFATQSAAELRTDLKRLRRTTGTGKMAVATPAPQPTVAKSRWARIAAIAAAMVVLDGLIAWLRSPLLPPRILASKQLTRDGLQKFNLVTDGNRIYFIESSGNHSNFAQVSVAGGEVALMNVPGATPAITDIAPDGSELLGWEGGSWPNFLWALPLPAGTPRRLGDLVGREPTCAPDGHLVFALGKDLYRAEHDGSAAKKVATAPNFPNRIRFSPDGAWIRFTAADPTSLT